MYRAFHMNLVLIVKWALLCAEPASGLSIKPKPEEYIVGASDFSFATQAFEVRKTHDMKQAIFDLDHSPFDYVCTNSSDNTATFGLRSSRFYSPPELATFDTLGGNCHVKNIDAKDLAIMVPTWPHDQRYFDKLTESFRTHLQVQGVDLVATFSSSYDSHSMLERCTACQETHMEVLIFNVLNPSENKFIYQSAKKIWSWMNMKQEHILVVDSDFDFMQAVNLPTVASIYEPIIYETVSVFGLDKEVLANTNELLRTDHKIFPLEPPWFIKQSNVKEMVNTVWGIEDYVEKIMKGKIIFEIIMYRLFMLKYYPASMKRIPVGYKDGTARFGFMFDWLDLDDTERLRYDPPPIDTHCYQQVHAPCDICWLRIHNDRFAERCERLEMDPLYHED